MIAVLPTILIGWFIYKKDKHKESKGLLIKLFLGGVAASFMTLFISMWLEYLFPYLVPNIEELSKNLIILFIQVFCGIAFVEEFSKWIMSYIIGYKSFEFDEVYDAIVYCVFVALGFATFENLLYVLFDETQLFTSILRGLTAVPGHVFDAIIMGVFLGFAKKSNIHKDLKKEKKYLRLSLIIPILTHTIYDYLIMTQVILLLPIWIFFIIGMYIYSIKKVNKVSKRDEKLIGAIRCPNCGNYGRSNFCGNCGAYIGEINPIGKNSCNNCGITFNGSYCPKCGKKIK